MLLGHHSARAAERDQAPVTGHRPRTGLTPAPRAADGLGRPHAGSGSGVATEATCVPDLPGFDRGCAAPCPMTAPPPAHPGAADSPVPEPSLATRQGGTVEPGTGEDAASRSAPVSVTAVDPAAETARASTSSSLAITLRSSSISAASNTPASRATSSRRPSTRTRAAASRSSSIPSTDATAHPSTIKPTQDAACLPHPERDHA